MYLLFEIIEYLTGLFTYFNCFLFTSFLFTKSKNFHWYIVFIFSLPCSLLAWYRINDYSPEVFSFMCIFLQICTFLWLFEGRVLQKAITTIIFYAGELLLANILSSAINLMTQSTMDILITPCTPIRITYLIMLYLIEFFVIVLLGRFVSKKQIIYEDSTSIIYASIFFTCDFAITFLVYYILTYFHTSDIRLTQLCIFINLLVLVVSIIGTLLIYQSMKHHMLKNENKMLLMQINGQIKLLESSEQKYHMVQAIRHDFKKYLISYKFLLEEGNSYEVIKNINGLLDGPLENIDIKYTENPMLNSLIYTKMTICQKECISFQTSIHINPLYRNIELVVLLSNLLDNAIEAECQIAKEQRLILMEMIENRQHISIVIQNFIEKSVLEYNPHLKSTKISHDEHGLGINNVKALVYQLNGFMDIFEKEQMFNVHILIPNIY